jgi:hypothetical protein
LNGSELPNVQHGTRHRIFQSHRVRNDRPHVRVRFEQERYALDRRGVGPFATLRESLLDKRPKIGEQADLPTRLAFTAKIVA